MFSKSVKSGVHLHAAVQQRSVPPPWAETCAAPQKSAADPFKAETLRIARRRRRRHHRLPSNYPSHFLRPRARCFSRRLSVPGRWMSLMNLPLIRHQRDRANCFLHRHSFSAGGGGKCLRSGRELHLGGGNRRSGSAAGRDRTRRSALRGWEEKTERPWLQLQSSEESFHCHSSRGAQSHRGRALTSLVEWCDDELPGLL